MSINCYCHPNHFECPVLYGDIPGWNEQPNYPVPSLLGEVYFGGYGIYIAKAEFLAFDPAATYVNQDRCLNGYPKH